MDGWEMHFMYPTYQPRGEGPDYLPALRDYLSSVITEVLKTESPSPLSLSGEAGPWRDVDGCSTRYGERYPGSWDAPHDKILDTDIIAVPTMPSFKIAPISQNVIGSYV